MEDFNIIPKVILYEFINYTEEPQKVRMFGYDKFRQTNDKVGTFSGMAFINLDSMLQIGKKFDKTADQYIHQIPIVLFGIQMVVTERYQQQSNLLTFFKEKTGVDPDQLQIQPLNWMSAQTEHPQSIYMFFDNPDYANNPFILKDNSYIETIINRKTKVEYRFILDQELSEFLKVFHHVC
jgi:hypothetical protein